MNLSYMGGRFSRVLEQIGGRYDRWCERHPKAKYVVGMALLLAPLLIVQIFLGPGGPGY